MMKRVKYHYLIIGQRLWFPVRYLQQFLQDLCQTESIDPYSGMNNMLIPDASDEFNKQYDGKIQLPPGEPNPGKTILVPYSFGCHSVQSSSVDFQGYKLQGGSMDQWE